MTTNTKLFNPSLNELVFFVDRNQVIRTGWIIDIMQIDDEPTQPRIYQVTTEGLNPECYFVSSVYSSIPNCLEKTLDMDTVELNQIFGSRCIFKFYRDHKGRILSYIEPLGRLMYQTKNYAAA